MRNIDPVSMANGVIWRAVADSLGRDISGESKFSRRRIMSDARDWFLNGGRGFEDICDLAGIEPSCVQAAFRDGRLQRAWLASSQRRQGVPLVNRIAREAS